jgi:hypothetical protein
MMIDEGRKNVNIVDLSKDGYFLSKKVPVSWNSPKRCYRILLLSGTTSQLTWEGQNETLRGKRHFLESMKGDLTVAVQTKNKLVMTLGEETKN